MRFPIETERAYFGKRFVNLSEALQESLRDMGIIDPETNESRQNYFDLPIEEGPILECASGFFNLTGGYHVGCTADLRPPNFGFFTSKGKSDTREGVFTLGYWRSLKLSTFLENASFRNERGVRDLESLARAYNQRGNCGEEIGIVWNGWTGEEYEQGIKTGFSSASIGLDFDGDFLKEFHGVDDFDEECWAFNSPLYGRCTPFYELGKNTKLWEIVEKYHEKRESLKHHHPQFMYGYSLEELGYSIDDILFGIFQIGSKIFPVKMDVEASRGKIIEACSSYRPAPKSFDYLKENRLYHSMGGGGD